MEAEAPPAAAPAAAAPTVKRLALRLDNGTLIRSGATNGAPEVLKPKDAWNAGLLDESHLIKAQSLLCELHSKLPEEGALKSVSVGSKRSLDSVLEVNQLSTKRSHSVGAGEALGAAAAPPTFAAGSVDPTDWKALCRRILNFLLTPGNVIDAEAITVFRNPVNLQALPEYLNHIPEPMWFNKILEKLDSGAYAGPEGLYRDVLLLCDNCYRFNVDLFPSLYGGFGVKIENTFLKSWARTPMAKDIPPRQFRPDPAPVPRAPPKKAGARSGGGGAAAPRRGRPGRPPGAGAARTKSVNSYGQMAMHAAYAAPAPIFTAAMQEALIAALHDEAVLNANMQAVIDVLQAADEMGVDEDGEPTLDLDRITPPTAAKLYDLVVVKTGRGPPATSAAAGAYRQMERDSDDDWDMDDD